MNPQRDDAALVDVLDVLLRDGIVVRADVIVSVAEIPLVGIKLTAVVAGMQTMTDYGLFEQWDTERRARAVERRLSDERGGETTKSPSEPLPTALKIDAGSEGTTDDGPEDGSLEADVR